MNQQVAPGRWRGICAALLAWSGLLSVAPAVMAQPQVPAHADAADVYDNFGGAVQRSGDRLLVAPWRGRPGSGAEVFIYRREAGDWVREAEFQSGWNIAPSLLPGLAGGRVNARTITLIGQPQQAIGGAENSGRVLVYKRQGQEWTLHATLAPPTPVAGGAFGIANGIQGEWAAVGQYGNNSVYLYHLEADTWVPAQTIAPAGQRSFGSELAFTGNQLIIRSSRDLDAYTLGATGWTFTQTVGVGFNGADSRPWAVDGNLIAARSGSVAITLYRRNNGVWAADGAGPVTTEPLLGFSVSDSTPVRLIGYRTQVQMWQSAAPGNWAGPTTITLPHILVPDILSSYAQYSFDYSGDHLYIGARRATLQRMIGQGLVYELNNPGAPALQRILAHGNGWYGDEFGSATAVLPDAIAVAAHGRDDGATRDVGSLHWLRKSAGQWTLAETLAAPQPGASDQFGETLASGGDLLIAGSLEDYGQINDHGRMRVYRVGATPSLLCELDPPASALSTPFAWRSSPDEVDLPFRPIESPVTDGEHILASYRNRLYAWRVVANSCSALGEIVIPGRTGLPGDPLSFVESDIEIALTGNGRAVVSTCCGLVQPSLDPTAHTTHVFDFNNGAWAQSYVYDSTTSMSCGAIASAEAGSVKTICQDSSFAWWVITHSQNGNQWSTTLTPLTLISGFEVPAGFSGTALITGEKRADNSVILRVRNSPAYSVDQTLEATAACFSAGGDDRVRVSDSALIVPCRSADAPGGRRSGFVQIFDRSTRGSGPFNPSPQIVAGELVPELYREGFEDVR